MNDLGNLAADLADNDVVVGLRVPVRWTFLRPAFANPSLLIIRHEGEDDDQDGDGDEGKSREKIDGFIKNLLKRHIRLMMVITRRSCLCMNLQIMISLCSIYQKSKYLFAMINVENVFHGDDDEKQI